MIWNNNTKTPPSRVEFCYIHLRLNLLLEGVRDLRQDDGDHHKDTAEILTARHLLLQNDRACNHGEHALVVHNDGNHHRFIILEC